MTSSARVLTVCCITLLLTCLAGCGGGMSDAQVKQSLVAFFEEIDKTYDDASAPPLDDPVKNMQWLIDLETKQLAITESYLSSNNYPAEIMQHMTDMRDGLSERIAIQEAWLDAGKTPETASATESSADNDAAMKSTSAETQLRIAAGI